MNSPDYTNNSNNPFDTSEVEFLRQQVQRLLNDYHEQHVKCMELYDENASLRDEISELEDKIDDLRNKNHALEKELVLLRNKPLSSTN